jgi:hypothetical protein
LADGEDITAAPDGLTHTYTQNDTIELCLKKSKITTKDMLQIINIKIRKMKYTEAITSTRDQ